GLPVVWCCDAITTLCRSASCWSTSIILTCWLHHNRSPWSERPGRLKSCHACQPTSPSRPWGSRPFSVSVASRLPMTCCAGCWPTSAIPHRAPALDVFLAIKPRIPLAQEFEQVPVLISQIQDHESLAWNVEHMNPHEVVEDPACGRVLNASAFWVRE